MKRVSNSAKKRRTPRLSRASQRRVESALKRRDLSELSDAELYQAWLEAYTNRTDIQLLALADNVSEPEAWIRLRALGRRAGLSEAEIDCMSHGRLEILSDEALDKLIAAAEG